MWWMLRWSFGCVGRRGCCHVGAPRLTRMCYRYDHEKDRVLHSEDDCCVFSGCETPRR